MAKILSGNCVMIDEYNDASTKKIDDVLIFVVEKICSLEKRLNALTEIMESVHNKIKDIEEKLKQKESRETNASIRKYYIGKVKEPVKFIPSSSNINC